VRPVRDDANPTPEPDARARMSRRTLLGGAAATGLAAVGLGAAVGSESYAAAATGLGPGGSILPPGSLPYPHLPAGVDTLPQIEHIVVIMMENHSFDDHLGTLGRGDGLTPGHDGRPVNYSPDPAGGFVRSFHNPNTCGEADSGIGQDWNKSHTSWANGTNQGFVAACGGASMGYWNADDLPYYHSMARKFPIGDRYFCSVMAQTYPNRRFLIAGTALGNISTDASGVSKVDAPNGTIFDRLNQYGISWKDYYPELPTCALFAPVFLNNPDKVVHVPQFFIDAAAGNLPAFSLIDPYTNYSEENGDITVGEAYAALFIDAVMQGPAWDKTALIWVYDEHGGWYDHVPPKRAIKPDNVPPDLLAGDLPGAYNFTGFRVPCCVVSPWAKKAYVSHQTFDHTSILKLIETKWNLPALTYRDANAHNMLDFFDFDAKRPPFAEPPVLRAPRNPFSSPAALPPNSLSAQDLALFHPICTDLPAGSLPPGRATIPTPPTDADSLLAAQRRAIGRQIRAQDAALATAAAGAASPSGRTTGRARRSRH
jgi:phospholipase C